MTIEDRNNRIIELLPAISDIALYVACMYHRMLWKDLCNDAVEYLCTKKAESLLYADKPYFYVAISNRCRDYIKSKEYNYTWANKFPHQSCYKEVEAVYMEDDSNARVMVEQIRELLSDRDWLILAGTAYYGYTQEETAKILGCSRSLVSKRRIKLKKLVKVQIRKPISKRRHICDSSLR